MTAGYLDISRPVGPDTPIWPGNPALQTSLHMSMANGDVANATLLSMDVHTGTHVDAPLHFVADGDELEPLGLDAFVGDAYVADVGDVRSVDAELLDSLDIPAGTERLLLRSQNSIDPAFRSGPFREDFVALTEDGASWVVEHDLRLIGIDYLSIQRFNDSPATHQILLGAGVAILEGIDLRDVAAGRYVLVCLPIRLLGVEAAPARAILLPSAG